MMFPPDQVKIMYEAVASVEMPGMLGFGGFRHPGTCILAISEEPHRHTAKAWRQSRLFDPERVVAFHNSWIIFVVSFKNYIDKDRYKMYTAYRILFCKTHNTSWLTGNQC